MRKEAIRLLSCPECRSQLNIQESVLNRDIIEGELYCQNCGSCFPIKDGVPILIPTVIRKSLSSPNQQLESLTDKEKMLLAQMKTWERLTAAYFDIIVDPLGSVKSAQICERYDELFVMQLLDDKIQRNKVVFIEIGSGPGRYFLLLGSKISKSPETSKLLRNDPTIGKYFQFDEKMHRNLQLIIGIDFIEAMIRQAMTLLENNGLQDLVYARIVPVVGAAQSFNLNLNEYRDAHKVVICVFQTLGNQPLRDLQIETLRTMKRLATPNGTVLVTVFNSKKFKEYGHDELYRDVFPVIGGITRIKKDSLESEKGFYTKWFAEEELNSLFTEAGLQPEIRDEGTLPIFDKDFDYISFDEQKKAREMIIVATAKV